MSRMPTMREQHAMMTNWLGFACQVLEVSVAVFLRRGFGARYFGGAAAAVIPAVLLYSLAWEGHDITGLLVFLALFIMALLKARIGSAFAERRGRVCHSYYSGTPTLCSWPVFRGRLGEGTAKGLVEPLCVALIGAALMSTSEPLGFYLVIAAVGLMCSVSLAAAYERRRLMDMKDAYIAQRYDAERFRAGKW
ncbi:MAG: hypothetical protein H6832_09245 [Planctomycetes bacterium]|nr:hypothetical protein [Planctomycetota bacterium]